MKNSPRGRPSLLFLIDRTKPASLQAQLLLNVKRLVHNGTLRPGDAVPSSRELAHDLQISRNTVLQAYERLIGEGYLETSTRRGLYVSALLNERSLRKAPLGDGITPARIEHGFRDDEAESCAPVPFRPCQPDVRLFPLAEWNRARTRALRRHGAGLLHYRSQQPLGLPALRRSLATYLQASRGVRCDWRQIAITTGSQQALFLLAHLLIAPGDSVAMEDPGYLGARLSWQYVRANIQPVGVDSTG